VGLFLAGSRTISWPLVPALVLVAALVVATCAVLSDLLWRWDHLPVLSMPFVMVTWIAMMVLGTGRWAAVPSSGAGLEAFIPSGLHGFLKALGCAICMPHPVPGLLLGLALVFTSRLLALCAGTGYLVGQMLPELWTAAGGAALSRGAEFNYSLVAMALGGTFLVPSLGSLVTLIAGVVLTSLGILLGTTWLRSSGLAVLAVPFVLATLALLVVLRRRVSPMSPQLVLEHPALPEENFERARLAKVRCFEAESLPLTVPYFVEWQVSRASTVPTLTAISGAMPWISTCTTDAAAMAGMAAAWRTTSASACPSSPPPPVW
jgi:urea transporter